MDKMRVFLVKGGAPEELRMKNVLALGRNASGHPLTRPGWGRWWWGDILPRPDPQRDPGSVSLGKYSCQKEAREEERGAGEKAGKQGEREGEKKEERGRFGP